MGLLTINDLQSHMYAEIIEEIVRGNDALVLNAIKKGEAEAKSYLNRFNTEVMFSADFEDVWFRSLVTDLVCWQLIKLSNPNINLELFRSSYEDAVKYFQKVLRGGDVAPDWPLRDNDPETSIDDAGNIEYFSNPKRSQHW